MVRLFIMLSMPVHPDAETGGMVNFTLPSSDSSAEPPFASTSLSEFAHEVMNLIHFFHHQLAFGAERDVEQDLFELKISLLFSKREWSASLIALPDTAFLAVSRTHNGYTTVF